MLETLLGAYLSESKFERVRQFNHAPQEFKFEEYTQAAVAEFRSTLEEVEKTRPDPKDIGKPRNNPWFL